MRTKVIFLFILLSLLLSLLLGLSQISEFEMAPQGFSPTRRQVLLLTPSGLIENFIIDRDPVWLHVYQLSTQREVTLADPRLLSFYLAIFLTSVSGLMIVRRYWR